MVVVGDIVCQVVVLDVVHGYKLAEMEPTQKLQLDIDRQNCFDAICALGAE